LYKCVQAVYTIEIVPPRFGSMSSNHVVNVINDDLQEHKNSNLVASE